MRNSKSISFIYLVLLFVLACPFRAIGEEVYCWEDYSTPMISPVGREVDFLWCRGNGFLCDENLQQRIEHSPAPDGKGFSGNWILERKKSTDKDAGGWASLRLPFPDQLWGKTLGVRFEFVATEPTRLDVWSLRGARKFWGYPKLQLNQHPYDIPAGRGTLVVRWKDMHVNPRDVGAVAIHRNGKPGTLGIVKIDLLLGDKKLGETLQAEKLKRKDTLRRTMLQWLARRGVDLHSLLSSADPDELERLAWIGVHLLAQEEQIENIGALAACNNVPFPREKLESRRAALRKRLTAGQDVSPDVDTLQADLDREIDAVFKRIPLDKRRWYIREDRFYRPDGRAFRMFGPFFFRSMYRPETGATWREWDLRYLAGMGCNGLRLCVVWKRLEPRRGKFDAAYLNMLRDICRRAERYGLAVSFDLHWPYPDWFRAGNPPISNPPQHGPYHWPEALIDSWGRIAEAFADRPNILAWEVPTNEPSIASFEKGLTRYPSDLVAWNEFLREKYKIREQLHAAWSAAGKQYGLADDENWENHSIRPLGYEGFSKTEDMRTAYAHNPRLWDHLQFCAARQEMVTGGIIRAIRKSVPEAVGMMQHTMGDMWDRTPVKIDYHAIQTLHDTNVQPGTHYGVGNFQSRKAASLSLASYDSEHQMENNIGGVRRHVRRGLGFCPFAFHARGGGGMLFADDTWMLKPSVAHLPVSAKWIRTYWPPKDDRQRAAVITNTRLEATTGRRVDGVIRILEQRHGLKVDVFEGLRVVRDPELLEGHILAVTCSSYMDRDLLAVLDEKFKGRVLLFGRLDVDAHAAPVLGEALTRRGIFVQRGNLQPFDDQALGRLDLTGTWDWLWAGKNDAVPPKRVTTPRGKWETMNVPGKWGETGLQGSLHYRLGDAWYRKRVDIPAGWKGRSLQLNIGAIDDFDWTYFNGVRIGKMTAADRQDHWLAPRSYAIPSKRVRFGKPNELLIRVRNTNVDGGIYKSPVEIVSSSSANVQWMDGSGTMDIRLGSSPTKLTAEDLKASAKILARLLLGKNRQALAMVRDGKWFWYAAAEPSADSEADRKAVSAILPVHSSPSSR
ncbi:MAG: cellulase family glycosylhydrolase [Phycisphaerae bacterium]|nr:cellulase family glycosylhydrolase [Phycisphaerae bacterium]